MSMGRDACRAAMTLMMMMMIVVTTMMTVSVSAGANDEVPALRLVPSYSALEFDRPVDVQWSPDGDGHVYVVEQRGRILRFEDRDDVDAFTVFVDMRQAVLRGHNEEGLLSFAFHPDYGTNREVFVYYSARKPNEDRARRGILSRFTVADSLPPTIELGSEEIILSIDQPWPNHNGSTICFGPDGYLYMSLGDGGYANDPLNAGQDRSTLLGSILRIDVNGRDGETPYVVPEDNPFVGVEGVRPEIWAYGLRNVWRMSFDRQTGELWAADVGQNTWEEVNIITRGGNYGWRLREGKHRFAKGEPGEGETLIDPIAEYRHNLGLSITGGYVYRGRRLPSLKGVYLYADYESKRMWGLRQADGEAAVVREVMPPDRGTHVSSFGEDPSGELVIVGFDRANRGDGRLYRLAILPGG